MMKDFELPSWLHDQDVDTIHRRMMNTLPDDIDKTEGGFPWDFTRPTAIEHAQMLEFYFPEMLKLMFPQYAYGKWLDLHGECVGLKRKAGNKASGIVEIKGISGTLIPSGFKFATAKEGDGASVIFQTLQDEVIPKQGTVRIPIEAVEAGLKGNVGAGMLTLMLTPLKGITSITNPEVISGGSVGESDDAFRERIDERNAAAETSYVGSISDYMRWAKEVSGVGSVMVMPEHDGPGSVKIIVMDTAGQPANERIIKAVDEHINATSDPFNRLAPIGAIVTVEAPVAKIINFSVKLVRYPEYETASIINAFQHELLAYFNQAKQEQMVKYNKIASILISLPGIKDFHDLTLNGASENIRLLEDEYPAFGIFDMEEVSV